MKINPRKITADEMWSNLKHQFEKDGFIISFDIVNTKEENINISQIKLKKKKL